MIDEHKMSWKRSTGLDRSSDISVNWPQATRPSLLLSPVIYSPTNNTKPLIAFPSHLPSLLCRTCWYIAYSPKYCVKRGFRLSKNHQSIQKPNLILQKLHNQNISVFHTPSVSGQVCSPTRTHMPLLSSKGSHTQDLPSTAGEVSSPPQTNNLSGDLTAWNNRLRWDL